MTCPHCHGSSILSARDEAVELTIAWVKCMSCGTRWDAAKPLPLVMREVPSLKAPVPRAKNLMLPITTDDEEDDDMPGSWTEERRKKFIQMMAAKQAGGGSDAPTKTLLPAPSIGRSRRVTGEVAGVSLLDVAIEETRKDLQALERTKEILARHVSQVEG